MVSSLDGKFAGLLPSLGDWIPGEDRGEEVGNDITTGDVKDITDHCSS